MSQSKGVDPMDTVTLAHAKEHLEELIERAARGAIQSAYRAC
jgi:hypothetical protein